MMSRFFLASTITVGVLSTIVFTQVANAAPPKHSKTTLAQAPAATLSSRVSDDYMDKIKEKILNSWTPAKGSAARVSIKFKVNRDGTISNVQLQNKSDIDAVNHAALDALVYCGNLPAIPSEMPNNIEVSAEFNSDYSPTVGPGYLRPGRWALEDSAELLKTAKSLQQNGNTNEALQGLEKANKLNPYDRRIRLALTKIYLQRANELTGDAAIEEVHRALLMNPKSDKARTKLNSLYEENGKAATYESHVLMARHYVLDEKYQDAMCEYGEAWMLDKQPSLVVEINSVCKLQQRFEQLKKWDASLQEHNTPQIKQAREQASLVYQPLKDEMKQYVQDVMASETTETNLKGYVDSVNLSDEFPYAKNASQIVTATFVPIVEAAAKAGNKGAEKGAEKAKLATLIDFYADWCPPCRMISPNIEALTGEFKGKVKVVRVNIDQNRDLARQWGVRAVPYIVLVRPDNRRVAITGYRDINYLRSFVQQGLNSQ